MDPHHFEKPDPNPHECDKPDPDPHESEKPDPDPHQASKWNHRGSRTHTMEAWRVGMPVVANLLRFDEEQDPDPDQCERSDPDPHESKRLDPDPHQKMKNFS